MAAIVGALRAVLSLESAAFQKGLGNAQKSLKGFDQRMKRIGGGLAKVGAALSIAGVGIAAAIKGQLDYADDLSKASQKFGVPIEQLSRLKYAADLSDVSMETLGGSLGKLSKKMAAAMKGGKSAKLFADLGISVADATGKIRPTEAVLSDFADRLAAMPDGAEKTALAMEVLGKSGAEMIPLLAGGGEALRQAGLEAEAMGLVIDTKTGKAAEAFNDNISRLKGTLTGLANQMMASLAPAMEQISAKAVDLAKWFQNLSPDTQEMIAVVGGLAVAFGPALIALGAVVSAVGTVASAFKLMSMAVLTNPVALALSAIGLGAYLIYENWDEIKAYFQDIWAKVTATFENAWASIKKAGADSIDYIVGKFNEFIALIQSVIDKAKAMGTAISDALGLSRDVQFDPNKGWSILPDGTRDYNPGYNMGKNMVKGMSDGIGAGVDQNIADIEGYLGKVTDAAKDTYDIHSPSKVFHRIGAYLTEGLANGIRENSPMAAGAMGDVSTGITTQMEGLSDAAGDFAGAWKDAFKSFVMGTASAREALNGLASGQADKAKNGLFDSLWSAGKGLLGFAKGGVFSNGQMQAFAKGGVVSGATAFGMRGGLGVMGEAGPEAIMPLTRGPGGVLGVAAHGAGAGGVIELSVTSDPGVIVSIARNESGMIVREAMKQVPAIMSDHTKRKG